MQAVEVQHTELKQPEVAAHRGLLDRLEKKTLLVVAAMFVLGFSARLYQLDAAGFSEDETNKLFAIRAYQQGDFTANAEHPMMLKMLCYCSVSLARSFNSSIGHGLGLVIPEETALRLPNVTFGALTVVPLFLFTSALFGFRIGLITGLLWALGLNAVWINRIVKEDTLLVFFIFTGLYLYNCAKERPALDLKGQERLYALAGAAFGLMLSSKYFPHHFGLIILFYHLVGYHSENNRARVGRANAGFFAAMLLAFVAFNPAVFVPQTWRYLAEFLGQDLVTHHGYLVMDSLYQSTMGAMPHGTPWYFYFLFLAVKVPLPVLFAFLVGLAEIFRHRGPAGLTRGYLFLRLMLFFWLVPMALAGSKFLRYTLTLMPLVYITAAIGALLIAKWVYRGVGRLFRPGTLAPQVARVAVVLLFVTLPAWSMLRSLPYPSLYLNPFGGERVGYFFPHDEFYDLGARESIKYLAETVPPGSSVASEIPGVVQYYLERFNRGDIRSEIMSHPNFSLNDSYPDYVLLQRGRMYFENRDHFTRIELKYPVIHSSTYFGADAVRVYAINGRTTQSPSTGRIPWSQSLHP